MIRRIIVAFNVVLFCALSSTGFLVAVDAHAALAAQNRAAVVIDDGAGNVGAACVSFTSDTISGVEALQLAGAKPVTYGFGSLGQAVCSLNGKGCSADPACLTCGGAQYWGYSQAQPNATGFTFSPVGAGATKVRDGGVEGWKWGKGVSPTFRSFASVCDPAPAAAPPTAATSPAAPAAPTSASNAAPATTTAPTTVPTAAGNAAATAGASTGTGAGPASTTVPNAAGAPAAATSSPTGADATTTIPGVGTAAPTGAESGTRALGATVTPAAGTTSPPWVGMGIFALVLAGLGGAGAVIWRRRNAGA